MMLMIMLVLVVITMLITIPLIFIFRITISSTQRSAKGPVDEMHVFSKMFSPRPEATFQVNFVAKTHLFNLKCKTNKKWLSPRRDAPLLVYFYIIQTALSSAATVM